MRVAVLGATGNVGTAVVRRLLAADGVTDVVGVARREPPLDVAPFDHPAFRWASADLGDPEADLGAIFSGVDTVVHVAWMFHPSRDATVTWRANVIGTRRVLAAAATSGVDAVVYASSVGAYSPAPSTTCGDGGDGTARDLPVDERHPTDALPTAAYGIQKSYVERVLDTFEHEHPSMRVVRMRSAFVFQRPASPEQRRIFAGPLLPGRVLASGRIPLLPVPKALRFQAVHADDLAAAYVEVVRSDRRGAFNIAGDGVIDRRSLGELFEAKTMSVPMVAFRWALAAGFHARLVPSEPGLFELFMSLPVMDTTRARRELGWQPTRDGLSAVRAFVEGLGEPHGAATPPLDPRAGGPARGGEVTTGVGARN